MKGVSVEQVIKVVEWQMMNGMREAENHQDLLNRFGDSETVKEFQCFINGGTQALRFVLDVLNGRYDICESGEVN
jgi:hypothetical protein